MEFAQLWRSIWLLEQVSSDLISSDHEKALIVLHEFLPDEKVQECARAFLKKEKVALKRKKYKKTAIAVFLFHEETN